MPSRIGTNLTGLYNKSKKLYIKNANSDRAIFNSYYNFNNYTFLRLFTFTLYGLL